MENQKQKKSVGTILLVILLLIVTIASLVLATYAWAKYSSIQTGEGTAEVAKWDVKVDIKEGTNQLEEQFEHVLEGKLAPGMSGSFEIDIDPGETEVDFHYKIVLDELIVVGEDGSEQRNKQAPAHLHFYTKSEHGTQDLIGKIVGSGDEEANNGASAEKYLEGDVIMVNEATGKKLDTPTPGAGQDAFEFTDGSNKKIKKVIYWEWPYEDPSSPASPTDDKSVVTTPSPALTDNPNGVADYDDQDTIDGMNAYKVKVKFRVITTQMNPRATTYNS